MKFSRAPPPTIQRTLNNVAYEFNSHGLQAWGYYFDPKPSSTIQRPIEFWRAQLAFRGFSARGSDIEVLKVRLRSTGLESVDAKVAALRDEMAKAYFTTGSKKRKADQQIEPPRPAPAVRPNAAQSAQSEQLIQARPPGFVVRKRFAEDDPEGFLREAFYDENGRDAGYPPVELRDIEGGYRCGLHQAAGKRLFHETSVTSVMVIGSRRNTLGQQRLAEINRQAWWPSARFQTAPTNDDDDEENSESESDGSEEGSSDDEKVEDDDWDVTGQWKLKCPDMASCFGQSSPYTLEIYSTERRSGKDTYGRFDFGDYEGVFRFSTQREIDRRMGERYKDDIDEFLLDADDQPSAEEPARLYRWRGRETGEGVIELRSENRLYSMTFSNGGRNVKGTWGVENADPGDVSFTGKKIGQCYDGMNIQHEWQKLDEAAYNKANRDRWRR